MHDYTRSSRGRLTIRDPRDGALSRGTGERSIESPHNPEVKRARALERDRSLRERERVFVAWGLHLAKEALRTKTPLRQAFVADSLKGSREGREILRGLACAGVPLVHTTARVLESIVEGCGDQGVLLLCARPVHEPAAILASGCVLVVALHGVQDPGNVGSIARTALALGASALVALPGCADPYGSRAVRAGMGAQFTLPVAGLGVPEFLDRVAEAHLQLVAADRAGSVAPADVDFGLPTVLILGSEGTGLPDPLLRAARCRVRIPMARGVESLNVHAAAAALLYEAARQRDFRSCS